MGPVQRMLWTACHLADHDSGSATVLSAGLDQWCQIQGWLGPSRVASTRQLMHLAVRPVTAGLRCILVELACK